ncbi:MAG TPA: hypothetical protein VH867_08735 [Burkholderiales bacterium]
MNLTATVTVKGDPEQLREYRGQVRLLLEEESADSYRELHSEAQLEYEFRLRGGIPFPPFVEASQAFPELTIEVRWTESTEGRTGGAIIQNGVLREQALHSHTPSVSTLQEVRAEADGRLRLALVCERRGEAWLGYAISADQHAFFRIAGSEGDCELSASDGLEAEWAERWSVKPGRTEYSEVAPREPIGQEALRELDRIAEAFTREWIWFEESPPEETAVERRRFENYGYPVRAANLRSEKLRKVLRPEGDGCLALGSFGEDTRWIAELLRRCWLSSGDAEQ